VNSGELLLACLLDVMLGDPRRLPHPVRLFGAVIGRYERWSGKLARTAGAQRMAGIALALGLPAAAYGVGWLALETAGLIHETARAALGVLLAWTTLAARDLFDHARVVLRALQAGDLEGARLAVARIVGRDTAGLSETEVVRATVETIAESASDGVIAPLFYLALGGPPLALAFKAVSTLDSMVGHLDERHRYLGWASARLDDAANWAPARLTALLFVASAGISDGRAGPAWRILRRDGAKHASPNSGRPEAAVAGALGVQLGGVSFYAGRPLDRPRLGDPDVPLGPSHIAAALRLLGLAAGAAVILAVGVRVQ
jgi:adenosylcobinamide-phosphate synthase